MRNEVYLGEASATSQSEKDGMSGSEPNDPMLTNIKSAIEQSASQADEESAEPGKAENADPKREHQAEPIPRIVWLTLPARWLFELIRSFLKRPDATRILSVLLLLVLLVLNPGFMVFLFLIALVMGLVLYFSFGPDRAQEWACNRYQGLRERDPDGADRLRRRAAVASKKLSEIVEKLPESWTTGLYLPDFEEPEELPEVFNTDPFERLAMQKK